jgi:GMP synthase-like glutamine amidotransferase
MNIAILQHMAHEGPGRIADWARERGHTIAMCHLHRAEPLPKPDAFDLLVVLGGSMSVYDVADHPWLAAERVLIKDALAAGRLVVGICLGAQQIAAALGAEVRPNGEREVGFWPVRKLADGLPLPEALTVLHWHGDTFALPPGASLLAMSAACRHQIFLAADGQALGLQCHLEATPEMVAAFCQEDAGYLIPPPGQGRWMQTAARMLAEREAYAPMGAALYNLLDAFTAQAREP